MFIRRCFVTLFVLLQCLAPLLHAHASGPLHCGVHAGVKSGVLSGIHMPAQSDAPAGGQQVQMADMAETLAITLATSLQARDEPPLAATPGLAFRLPGIARTSAAPWAPSAPPRTATRYRQHLTPLPGAPPRV